MAARVSKKQERALDIVSLLKRMYPKAKCSLDFTNAFELLIATMLSAQSTDARVNIVTKSLFRKYPNPQAFASASQVEMERAMGTTLERNGIQLNDALTGTVTSMPVPAFGLGSRKGGK